MKRSQGWQRGATLVEAAAVILLLFTFVLAIIEFGRVMSVYQTMTSAAREGARFGVAPCQSGDTKQTSCSYDSNPFQAGTTSDPAIIAYVTDRLKAGGVIPGANAVTVTHAFQVLNGSNVQYRYLTVQVTGSYKWMILPFGSLPMSTKAVMKEEIELLQ